MLSFWNEPENYEGAFSAFYIFILNRSKERFRNASHFYSKGIRFSFLLEEKYPTIMRKKACSDWVEYWHFETYRSSPPDVVLGKGVLKICIKFTGEHSCRSVISIKLRSSFIEIILRHRCSPVNLLHIFRVPLPRNTSGRLVLGLGNRTTVVIV